MKSIGETISIGKCSICGGPVEVHRGLMSLTIIKCKKCGAVKTANNVIPMTPAPKRYDEHPGWRHDEKICSLEPYFGD